MEDICEVINRKIWTVEQFLSQTGEILEKSKSLSPTRKKEVMVTIADWSEDRVRRHVETVREAVVYPIRHENKRKLDKIGVCIDRLPEDVFDNTEMVNKVLDSFNGIKTIDHQLTDILTNERIIEKLFRDSPDEIEQKLQDILNAKSSLKGIVENGIDVKLRYELLKRSLEDVGFLEEADEILSNIEYLHSFGVLTDYTIEYEEFCQTLNQTSTTTREIIEDYGISRDEIQHKVGGKILSKAHNIMEQLENQYAEKRGKLFNEWRVYATTLKSLGEELPEPRNNLPELQERVNEARKRCLKYLGQRGFRLLKFLREEDNFPEKIDIAEVKKTLIVLRPMFLKGLSEES